MKKLIETFRAKPTVANAKRLTAYMRKHTMALCTATAEDEAIIAEAARLTA